MHGSYIDLRVMHWFWFYSIENSSILDEPWLTVLVAGCNGSSSPEGDAHCTGSGSILLSIVLSWMNLG